MLIEMKKITKSFGSLVANDDIDLMLNKGEILAVVGENGAGKSTLMKILYGLETPDSGQIYVNGEKVVFKSPHDAIKHGIGMVQQHFMLFPPFSAAENIVYDHEPRFRRFFFDRKKAFSEVKELCSRYGLFIDPEVKVEDCPVGLQQRIEILKVLYQGVDIIIFDEPSAVLTPPEITELLKTILSLKAAGKSIILITHKLNEVMAVSDRVMVMRRGQLVKTMEKSETSIKEMSTLMVGHELVESKVSKLQPGNDVINVENLVLKGTSGKNILDKLSFNVRKGEIVGIAGVSGNGQSELIQCLTGLIKYDEGKISLCRNDITGKKVKEIRNSGCACIPEDRYFWGSAGDASLNENMIMAHYHKKEFLSNGIFHDKNIKEFASKAMNEFDVRRTNENQSMKELSGGNAQKLIVAREMQQNSPFLIAAEPTRGIDIGACMYIHDKLLEKRDNGDAILLISSELSEVMKLSDRIYVMYEGRIAGELTREEATSQKIGLLMMGGKLND